MTRWRDRLKGFFSDDPPTAPPEGKPPAEVWPKLIETPNGRVLEVYEDGRTVDPLEEQRIAKEVWEDHARVVAANIERAQRGLPALSSEDYAKERERPARPIGIGWPD